MRRCYGTSVWEDARERFRKKSAKLPLNLQLFSLRYEFSLLSTYQHGQTLVDLLVSQRNLIFKPDLHDSVMNKWVMRKGNCIQFSKFPRPHELQNDLIPLFPSSNKVVAWNLLQVVWEILGHSRKHKLKGGGEGGVKLCNLSLNYQQINKQKYLYFKVFLPRPFILQSRFV